MNLVKISTVGSWSLYQGFLKRKGIHFLCLIENHLLIFLTKPPKLPSSAESLLLGFASYPNLE